MIQLPIGGTGGITQAGNGTLNLTGANTYTGNTTVSQGTLVLGDGEGGSITSNVSNAATFINYGTVTGTLTNSAGTATNYGSISGAVTVSGGSFTNNDGGTLGGGLTNSATVNANGGFVNGAIANNAGTFNVGGTVSSDNAFANASGATLAVAGTGSYTLGGLLTNAGTLTVDDGGLLDATAGGLTNTSSGNITVSQFGTLRDDLNNAGTVTNNGSTIANVATNSGTITNTGAWTGDVASSTGTIVNNGAWTGTINSSGSYSGVGLVRNLNLSGGSFTPGNGTAGSFATVTGDLFLTSGVQYIVQVTPAAASFTNVGGAAKLGGATVKAIFANGAYIAKQYTIVSTQGGVKGSFGTLISTNLPTNFTASLSTDARNAYLNLALKFTAPAPTQARNSAA